MSEGLLKNSLVLLVIAALLILNYRAGRPR